MVGQPAQSEALALTAPLLMLLPPGDATLLFSCWLGLPRGRLSRSILSCCLWGLLSILPKYPVQPRRERSVLPPWVLRVMARSGSGLARSSGWQRGR